MSGQLDLEKDSRTVAYAELKLGYFLFQGFEVALTSLQGTKPDGRRDETGIILEYDFTNGSQFIPFFGGEAKHAAPPVGAEEGQRDAVIGGAFLGMNLVVAPNAALALSISAEFSDQQAFGDAGARSRRNRESNLELRLFF